MLQGFVIEMDSVVWWHVCKVLAEHASYTGHPFAWAYEELLQKETSATGKNQVKVQIEEVFVAPLLWALEREECWQHGWEQAGNLGVVGEVGEMAASCVAFLRALRVVEQEKRLRASD